MVPIPERIMDRYHPPFSRLGRSVSQNAFSKMASGSTIDYDKYGSICLTYRRFYMLAAKTPIKFRIGRKKHLSIPLSSFPETSISNCRIHSGKQRRQYEWK